MDFKNLLAYKKAYQLAMDIFEISKTFPKEERYSLTDQIRRSSRSVCSNIAESYRKRRYIKHYRSKLTDADAENSETSVWLDFSYDCNYINGDLRLDFNNRCIEIGKLINNMINSPEKFGVNTSN